MQSVFRGRMAHRVTVHQTRTLSYDVTSALKRTFILRPFLSLCFVRFRHFENKAAEVERRKEKTHSHSPRKHLIAKRKFFIFSRWKIRKWISADLVKTHGSSLVFYAQSRFRERRERKRYKHIWQTGILDQQRMEECLLYSLLSSLCVPSQFLVPMKI